ncbi:MAG: ATP-binding protein [Breznakiellaceae bacterium]
MAERADGRSIELKIYPLFSGSPGFDGYNRWVLVLEDITSRITYEEKLLQAEKVASVSMLSAGVAHEINNPLTSILTNVQNLISEIKDEEILDLLRLIEQETRRIARIVKELLDFSSSQRNITGGTNIAACVHNVIQLIGYYLTNKKDIHIKVEIPDHLPLLNISEDMFKQILLNIIKNSLEAIVNSGEIEIQAWEINPNNVCIQIKDTGVGIPKEILPRVFDPFFTTKDSGIGMGLSVVYGILQRSGGNISIKSEIKRGTTVILTIPTFRETKE